MNEMAQKSMHNYIFAKARRRSPKETIHMFPVIIKNQSVHLCLNTITKVAHYRVCQIRRGIVAFISHFGTGVDIES